MRIIFLDFGGVTHPCATDAEARAVHRGSALATVQLDAFCWFDILPGLLAGDLNASPWSQATRELHALGWYRANDLQATWPALGRGWLGIAIDQVVVRGPWRVAEQHLGPDLGADHLPRRLHLQLLEND